MARAKTSPIEDMMIIASKLPWWVGMLLALVSYLVLHSFAIAPIAPLAGPNQMGDYVAKSLVRTIATFGQLVLPMIFVIGALISAFNAARQRKLQNIVTNRTDIAATTSKRMKNCSSSGLNSGSSSFPPSASTANFHPETPLTLAMQSLQPQQTEVLPKVWDEIRAAKHRVEEVRDSHQGIPQ